jgi:hypothetical protein
MVLARMFGLPRSVMATPPYHPQGSPVDVSVTILLQFVTASRNAECLLGGETR